MYPLGLATTGKLHGSQGALSFATRGFLNPVGVIKRGGISIKAPANMDDEDLLNIVAALITSGEIDRLG